MRLKHTIEKNDSAAGNFLRRRIPSLLILLVSCLLMVSMLTAGCILSCIPDWQCSDWTPCTPAGTQARVCNDLNSCGSLENQPQEVQSCTPPVTLQSPSQAGAQDTSPILGHPFSIRGQYYDADPSVPMIIEDDLAYAKLNALETMTGTMSYDDLWTQYRWRCFSLKNEGTQSFTTTRAITTGTSSREQMLNFYRVSLDTINREENCQRTISIFSNQQLSIPLQEELSSNMQISRRDENIEVSQYNDVADIFNKAILQCPSGDQVIGLDGLCHGACSSPTIYCPSDSTCTDGSCHRCPSGFRATESGTCIPGNNENNPVVVPQYRPSSTIPTIPPVSVTIIPSTTQTTVPPGPVSRPRYTVGDIVGSNDPADGTWLIVSYDEASDTYSIDQIYRLDSGVWGCVAWDLLTGTDSYDRESAEEQYPYKYAHMYSLKDITVC